VLGGILIAMKLPLHVIFLLVLIPLAIGTVASILIARLFGRGFQDDVPEAQRTPAPLAPHGGAIATP
jgi:Na+-driven multidrug efflux pump